MGLVGSQDLKRTVSHKNSGGWVLPYLGRLIKGVWNMIYCLDPHPRQKFDESKKKKLKFKMRNILGRRPTSKIKRRGSEGRSPTEIFCKYKRQIYSKNSKNLTHNKKSKLTEQVFLKEEFIISKDFIQTCRDIISLIQTVWNPFKNLHASMHKNGHGIFKICTKTLYMIFVRKSLDFKF